MITRFAPSPTGKLHIGGARTALFNWLYAKANNGKFVIRIEDTDKERSTPEFTKSIFEGLKLLGIDYDGDPVIQSENIAAHSLFVSELIASGGAYECLLTPDEVEACKVENKGFRSPWRDKRPTDAERAALNNSYPIRIRIPEGDITFEDQIRGTVTFHSDNVDDFVIMRSDGTPTYNLAVVVDDNQMGVTNVIRGDDHISNTGKQIVISDALGFARPIYAHVPLIHGEDGKKLSKRHGAQDVQYYLDMGFLPEALVNYLCKLGWSHGNEEYFDLATAVSWFDIVDVKSSPARLDMKKLKSINSHWMRLADNTRLAKIIGRDTPADLRAIDILKHKVSTLIELKDEMDFIKKAHDSDFVLDESLTDAFAVFRIRVLGLKNWTPEGIHDFILKFSEDESVPMKMLGTPLRQMLTGRKTAPELHNLMYILDKAEVSERIRLGIVNSQRLDPRLDPRP